MSIPMLSPARVRSGAPREVSWKQAGQKPGQVLFTANMQPGVQSSYFTDMDVLTVETGWQLLYPGG